MFTYFGYLVRIFLFFFGCFLYLLSLFYLVSSACSINNGGCSHFCVPKTSGQECKCPTGLAVKQNGKTCEESKFFSLIRNFRSQSLYLSGRSLKKYFYIFRLLRNYEIEEGAFTFREDLYDHVETEKENIIQLSDVTINLTPGYSVD